MPFQLVDLIDVAGGEVYGKIRLQKMIFLLDNLGLESNYSFSYHHYGPYSSELADKIISEVNSSKIIEEQKRRMSDGVSYSVFKVRKKREKKINKKIGKLDYIEIKKYIDIINLTNQKQSK